MAENVRKIVTEEVLKTEQLIRKKIKARTGRIRDSVEIKIIKASPLDIEIRASVLYKIRFLEKKRIQYKKKNIGKAGLEDLREWVETAVKTPKVGGRRKSRAQLTDADISRIAFAIGQSRGRNQFKHKSKKVYYDAIYSMFYTLVGRLTDDYANLAQKLTLEVFAQGDKPGASGTSLETLSS